MLSLEKGASRIEVRRLEREEERQKGGQIARLDVAQPWGLWGESRRPGPRSLTSRRGLMEARGKGHGRIPIRKPLQVDTVLRSDGLGWAGLGSTDPLARKILLDVPVHLCTCVHAVMATAANGRADQQSLLAGHGPPGRRTRAVRSSKIVREQSQLVSRFVAEMRKTPEIRREKILPDCLRDNDG